jgi:hypothetical protein
MCHQPQQILLVLATHATCFGHTDHPHALNTLYLKLRIKCLYTEFAGSHKFCRSY